MHEDIAYADSSQRESGFTRLDNEISRLHATVEQLTHRLEPVLIRQSPEPGPSDTVKAPTEGDLMATAAPDKPKTRERSKPEPPAEPQDGKPALFDKRSYDDPELAIAKVDGNQIDKIRLTWSGSIMLDRSSKADVALYNKLILSDSTVTLMVEGECTGTGAKKNTNRDGDLDVIVGVKNIKVSTVYVATAELGMTPAGTAEPESDDDQDGGEQL